jgi:hypothetical protein
MSSIAEFGDRTTGHPVIEHPRRPELIMPWIEACTDPRAHMVIGDSNIATNPITHPNQLMAVWIEPGTGQVLSPRSNRIGMRL